MVLFKIFARTQKCFDEFTKNYLKLTDKTYYTFEELKMNPPCADIIIAGSDQIWNPLFPNGKDPSYYIDLLYHKQNACRMLLVFL